MPSSQTLFPAEQPDPVTAVDQPPDEELHLLDVDDIDLVGLLAVIIGAVVSHHTDADGLRVTVVLAGGTGRANARSGYT